MSLRFRHLIPLLAAAACVGESPPESATPDAAPAAEAAAPAAPPSDVIAGEFVVKLDQELTLGVATQLGSHRVVPVMKIADGTWLVRLDTTTARAAVALPELTLSAITEVSRVPGVRYAHPNYQLEFSRTPNDEYVQDQSWHHYQIRLYDAWDLITGPVNSNDVRIAVLDTGRTNHPDTVWAEGANFTVSPATTDTLNPFTYHHGVMVAGIIGARTNNVTGVAGVCWNCTIIPVRANNGDEGMNTAAVAAGLRWAAGLRDLAGATTAVPLRAHVANLSFNRNSSTATCDDDPTLRDAINDAVAAGLTVVASSGNHAFANGPSFPANCRNTIAVAASNQFDAISGYSDRGMGIDVVAPGGAFGENDGHGTGVPAGACGITSTATGGIVSTWTSAAGAHCYRQSAGTSFASPHVSGVIGLMLAARPGLSPARLRAVLRLTASPPQPWGPQWGFTCGGNACGSGRINAHAAVDAINDGTPAIAEVAPGFIDFGSVTGSASRTVVLRNIGLGNSLASTGTMDLVTSSTWFRFGGSCSGTSCNQSYSLPTNASINTQIVCQPTGADTQTAELVYNHSGVGQARVQLSCTGTATPAQLSVSPTSPNFGNVRVGSFSDLTITISNPGGTALSISSTGFINAAYTAPFGTPTSVAAGTSTSFTVRCTPTAEGAHSGTLRFFSNASNGNPINVPLACNGVAPRLTVNPPSLPFGNVRIGSFGDLTLTVSNPGGATLNITSTGFTNSVFTAPFGTPTSLAAGASTNVTIRCTPTVMGANNGTLQFSSNAINGSPINVPLTCNGTIGIPNVTPNPLAFGGVYVGTSADRTVTVRNDGNASLTISEAVVLAGTTCARVGALPGPLAPNASGAITVRCTPPTEGNHSATLRVFTDGGNVDVAVTVTGIISRFTVSPLSIDYGIVEVGGRVTRDVTITSTGSAALSVTGIVASGGAFSVANQTATLPPSATLTSSPRCSPSAVGVTTGWIEVRTNVGNQRVNLTCTGGQAQLTAPTWIDLPDVLLGGATTKTFTISNPGTVPLTINSATITGGNGFSVTSMPTTIAPGGSVSATVRCSPSVAGYFNGTLQLASNAATSPTSIGIGCRAATGRITVLDGSNLELGWCQSGTVTIQNSGVGPLEIAELRFTQDGWMSTSGIALPATLAAGEITSWQVDCVCAKPAFSVSAKHYAKHDGVWEGSLGSVTCGVENGGGGDTIELPIDPPPATE